MDWQERLKDKSIKINIGSGSDFREDYINVDITDWDHYNKKSQNVDVIANIKDKLPFEDNFADYILCQEIFEHVNRFDALELLKEIKRVLKPKGQLELTVPPAEQQLKLLLTVFNRLTTMDEFQNAHQRGYNVWKAIDDLCGGTWKTFQDGKDLGDFPSHKCFYSHNMLKMLFYNVGLDIISIDSGIKIIASKNE